ncbi:endolysin, partial [Cronobacter sakazakii]
GDLLRVTQIINGGQNGIDDRRARFEAARRVL